MASVGMTAMIDTDDGFLPLMQRRAAASPDRRFASYLGTPITYGALDASSGALAAALQAQGLSPGDRVAVMLDNSPAVLVLLFALAKAHLVWVPISAQARGDNLAYILSHCEPGLVIAEHDLVDTIRASAASLGGVPLWTHGGEVAGCEAMEPKLAGPAAPPAARPPAADDTYAIMYTSGTTGRPKGVLVSHRMLRLAGEAAARVSGAKPGDVMHMWEPLYHIGGAQMIVLPLIRDCELAMVERFSASRFWQEIKDLGASHVHFLGGILQILLRQPTSPLDRKHGARIAWGGGCPREVWRPFEERFGVHIRECYGMTEVSSFTSYNDTGLVGSVGRPLPWFTVEIRGADGRPVAAGERGEIVVRTSLPGAITRGYFRNPEATAAALRDGAFHTGDVGSWDESGNLYFHGRMTDNVRVRGHNVTSFEVEHVAAKHPAVEDCAMIGVAADVGEQDIKLFVKLRPGAELTPAELSAWLARELAPYQNPRYIMIVADFERTPSQRIMKHRLSRDTTGAWDRSCTPSDSVQR